MNNGLRNHFSIDCVSLVWFLRARQCDSLHRYTENIYYFSAFVNVRIAQEPALKFQSADKASRGSFYNLYAVGCDHHPFNSYVSK